MRRLGSFFAALAIVLLSPVFALVSLASVLFHGFPVFFKQTRVGKNGKLFQLIKFRSMTASASGALITNAGDRRITRYGAILRRTKLDEIPQLWNVMVGDMQFVGPRPEVVDYVELYDERQMQSLDVLPGVTSKASLIFRNEEELLTLVKEPDKLYREILLPLKIELCIDYETTRKWWSDFFLIFQTLLCVFRLYQTDIPESVLDRIQEEGMN